MIEDPIARRHCSHIQSMPKLTRLFVSRRHSKDLRSRALFLAWVLSCCMLLPPAIGAQDMPPAPLKIDLATQGAIDALIVGARVGDQSDVIATGDLNGDGVTDTVLGAHLSSGPDGLRLNAGAVYVFFGRPILSGGTVVSGEDQADITIFGAFDKDRAGVSVAVGDVNNDGMDDIVVGAPGGYGPGLSRPSAGEVYVFFGGAGLRAGTVRDVSGQVGSGPDMTIYGVKAGDGLGAAIVIADFNGDGLKDLALSASNTTGFLVGAFQVGTVYVLLGSGPRDVRPGTFRDLAAPSPDAADVVIGGPEAVGVFGLRLAAGDFNGDGISDLVATAPIADGPDRSRPNAGQAYIFFGGVFFTARPLRDLSKRRDADVIIFGGDGNDALGLGGLLTADLNKDGFDDLIVSAPSADGPGNSRTDAGEVYLFLGGPAFKPGAIRDAAGLVGALPDEVIYGGHLGDQIGYSLAAGPVNGDDLPDLVIGAPNIWGDMNMRQLSGGIYIIYSARGITSGLVRDVAGTEGMAPEVIIFGATVGDEFGFNVAVGDVNGDGLPDLLGSAPFAGDSGIRRSIGAVFVILGRIGQ